MTSKCSYDDSSSFTLYLFWIFLLFFFKLILLVYEECKEFTVIEFYLFCSNKLNYIQLDVCDLFKHQPKSLNLAKLLKAFEANIKATYMLAKKKKRVRLKRWKSLAEYQATAIFFDANSCFCGLEMNSLQQIWLVPISPLEEAGKSVFRFEKETMQEF